MSKMLPIITLGLIAISSQAENTSQINRYATISNKPSAAQINPLSAIKQVHFPKDVQTIEQALEWWLKYTGFSLVSIEKRPESLVAVLKQPLPQVDRTLGPMTIKEGLEVLVGQQTFLLVEDPLQRQVNFSLKTKKKSGSKS
ncbi:TPA: hypothetical protein ACGWTM_002956 [Legionella pneumophila]